MTQDLYHKIYTSEIFERSQCIWHENNVMNILHSMLIKLGYEPVQDGHKTWRRGEKTVVVCLVDDYISTTTDYDVPVTRRFDANTVVITDNLVTAPTLYKVIQLPPSFFGIYHYQPQNQEFNPTRRFNFAVNRIDSKRLLLLLEIALRSEKFPDRDTADWINFNCWSWEGDNQTPEGLRESFTRVFESLETQYRELYAETFQRLVALMPMRNHDMTIEQSHVAAFVNMVVETYSADTSVALSEKTFRALQTPAPWQIYAGQHAVAWLESLGFDVMHDVVNHNYDTLWENKTANYGDKIVEWVHCGNDAYDRLHDWDSVKLRHRCATAARHNQQVLASMSKAWPVDFAAWLPRAIDAIK